MHKWLQCSQPIFYWSGCRLILPVLFSLADEKNWCKGCLCHFTSIWVWQLKEFSMQALIPEISAYWLPSHIPGLSGQSAPKILPGISAIYQPSLSAKVCQLLSWYLSALSTFSPFTLPLCWGPPVHSVAVCNWTGSAYILPKRLVEKKKKKEAMCTCIHSGMHACTHP